MKLRNIYATLLYLVVLAVAASTLKAGFIAYGIAVCTAPGGQLDHRVASDGAGGAIIAWEDERVGGDFQDIYAQRISASGAVLWQGNGVAVCAAAGIQQSPQIIPDGSGGALIVWEDERNGNSDIYGQRIDANGAPQWTADGVAICTAARAQIAPRIVPDGSGGMIVAWEDRRGGGNNRDIYAQRIGPSGNILWTADGVALCSDTRTQQYPEIAPDGSGGAVVAWQDRRNGGNNRDIYAQRVDSAGSVLWADDGAGICTAAGQQTLPKIVSDGAGGAIIAWLDGGTAMYAQRVDAAGAVQWAADGIAACPASASQEEPVMISDDAGGAILVWPDTRYGNYDIYAQRIDASGVRLWGDEGSAICTGVNDEYAPQAVSDGANGAIITYELHGPMHDDYDIYAQHIGSDGNVAWAPGGIAVCIAALHQSNPRPVCDGSGGALVAWYDERNGDADIYAARIDALGAPVSAVLQSYIAYPEGTGITVQWELSTIGESDRFVIYRAEGVDGDYREVVSPEISGDYLSYVYRDTKCNAGAVYSYRIEIEDGDGRYMLFETEPISVPSAEIILHQNHPNPFNPSTMIRYYLHERCRAVLDVYNSSGRRVIRLVDRDLGSGTHGVRWNGNDAHGVPMASGVYFYRLAAGKETISKKMILLR